MEAPPRPGLPLTALLGPSAQLRLDIPHPARAPDRLLTLVTELSPVAGGTLPPTLATDGVAGRARRTGARVPAPRPEKAGLTGCRGEENGVCRVSRPGDTPAPGPGTHRPGTARPGSRPCRHSCRPSCRTPACSAAHTGTPPSSRARRPTAGRLHPHSVRARRPPLPGPAPQFTVLSPGPGTEPAPPASATCLPEDRATAPTL